MSKTARNFLLDTNVAVALLNGESAVVVREARERRVYLSVVTAAELIFGARRSVRPAENLERYSKLASRRPVLRPDATTAIHYADLRLHTESAGKPIPQNDLWQAALARQMGLVVVTRDRHFDGLPGVEVESW